VVLRKGLFIKDIRSQGGGVAQCGHFSDKGGSSDADVCSFWCKKLRIFHGERGLSQYGYSADKGGGWSVFRDFVQTSFMDCPKASVAGFIAFVSQFMFKIA